MFDFYYGPTIKMGNRTHFMLYIKWAHKKLGITPKSLKITHSEDKLKSSVKINMGSIHYNFDRVFTSTLSEMELKALALHEITHVQVGGGGIVKETSHGNEFQTKYLENCERFHIPQDIALNYKIHFEDDENG